MDKLGIARLALVLSVVVAYLIAVLALHVVVACSMLSQLECARVRLKLKENKNRVIIRKYIL